LEENSRQTIQNSRSSSESRSGFARSLFRLNGLPRLRGQSPHSLEREYASWKLENQSEITPQNRQEILAIGEDLPKVWNAQTTTNADRKYLLRLIVKQVIVDQKREQGKVWFQINWQTGACTQYIFTRTCISYREHGEAARIEQRVRELHANGVNDRLIAETLNAEGLRTTYGQPFKYQNIVSFRRAGTAIGATHRKLTFAEASRLLYFFSKPCSKMHFLFDAEV
jgi:hypothetical protein